MTQCFPAVLDLSLVWLSHCKKLSQTISLSNQLNLNSLGIFIHNTENRCFEEVLVVLPIIHLHQIYSLMIVM